MLIPICREISRSAGQCVRFPISIAGSEHDLEVKLGHQSCLSYLSPIQEGFGSKVLQVVVVRADGEGGAMYVHVPFIKARDDGYEFFITNSIVALHGCHFLGEECNRVQDGVSC